MKKIFTLAITVLVAAAVSAGGPARPAQYSRVKEMKSLNMPVEAQKLQQESFAAQALNKHADFSIANQLPLRHRGFAKSSSRRKIQVVDHENQDYFYAEYRNPEGTLFGGFDPEGYGWYFDLPAVFGAWKQGIDAWLWPNISEGATSFQWQTDWYKKYHDGISWDEDNNLVDSVPALYKGNIDYSWSYQRAVLFAQGENNRLDTFMLNAPQTGRIDTLAGEGNIYGGAENPLFNWHKLYTQYGWDRHAALCGSQTIPLCNIPTMIRDTGRNAFNYDYVQFYYDENGDDQFAYLYGSEEYPFFLKVEEGGIDYNNVHSVIPSAVVQEFEKPQVPLYIASVSLPIVSVNPETYEFQDPVFSSLRMRLYKFDGESETLLADVTATPENATDNSSFQGKLVTFPIQEVDELGDVIGEGVVVDSEFYVIITGFDAEGNDFSSISGYSPYGGMCYVLDAEGNMYVDGYGMAPYITLNGNYSTFEVAEADLEAPSYERLFVSKEGNLANQTINVKLMEYDDEYLMVVGDDNYQSLYVAPLLCVLSTFTPIDSLSNELLIDMTAPEYVEGLDFDYEEELQEGAGISWFQYCGVIIPYILIPVSERDNVYNDDKIILSKNGRSITLVITGEKDHDTALDEVSDSNAAVACDNGNFRLSYDNAFDRVEMINANGQRVADYQLPQSGEFTINASSMPNGVYLFRMTGKNVAKTLRALK